MTNALKVLLFLASGTAVVGVGAYLTGALDPFLSQQPPAAVAQLPAAQPSEGGETTPKSDRVDAAEKPADAQPATPSDAQKDVKETTTPAEGGEEASNKQIAAVDPAAPVAEAAQPEKPVAEAETPAASTPDATAAPAPDATAAPVSPRLPTFDLVRVEGDGSTVIAGTASAGATVELLTGGKVIGTAIADAAGDFAVVLDTPLSPGDYQITIRATAKDGATLESTQTAIVTVPQKKTGQVLAMIDEPGKASEIISVPQAEPADAAPAETTDAAKPSQTEVTAVEPEADVPAAPVAPVAPVVDVGVGAVEIDGSKVFVAGHAPAGATVRVYANEILLGQTKASPAGRFLVEATRDLPVGSYIVRADVMGPDGKQVLARAAVPFEREPGENVAAVAQPAIAEAAKPAPAATEEPKPSATVADAKLAEEQPATAETPAASQPAVAAEAAPAPDKAIVEQQPAEAAAAPAPTEATAPPLQNVNSAVIIRRGDTLWRISKRVYGRGVRYSTIYLANQDQIRDPDLIWPGQVFDVPDQTTEGETADMTRMGEQATTIP